MVEKRISPLRPYGPPVEMTSFKESEGHPQPAAARYVLKTSLFEDSGLSS